MLTPEKVNRKVLPGGQVPPTSPECHDASREVQAHNSSPTAPPSHQSDRCCSSCKQCVNNNTWQVSFGASTPSFPQGDEAEGRATRRGTLSRPVGLSSLQDDDRQAGCASCKQQAESSCRGVHTQASPASHVHAHTSSSRQSGVKLRKGRELQHVLRPAGSPALHGHSL